MKLCSVQGNNLVFCIDMLHDAVRIRKMVNNMFYELIMLVR